MLNDVECANHVVFSGMRCGMVGNGLASDVESAGQTSKIRIEADIRRVRYQPSQPAFAAADIENSIPGPEQFRDASEFGSGKTGRSQQSMQIPAAVEVEVKAFIARQHRCEKGEATRRFPQAETRDAGKLPVCPHAKSRPPQPAD
jgi:hypothetical protein